MNGLVRLLEFVLGRPPSALPCLAASQYGQLSLPTSNNSNNGSVLAPWNDWLTKAVPKNRTAFYRCKWNRRYKVVQPVDRFVQCKTCGGTKDKDILCPNCLKDILVKTAEIVKGGEEARKANPYDQWALARSTFETLVPKFKKMIRFSQWHDYKNQHVNYDYLLWELNRSPLLKDEKKEPEEKWEPGNDFNNTKFPKYQ
eukprot:scpid100349/ scgid9561/ 